MLWGGGGVVRKGEKSGWDQCFYISFGLCGQWFVFFFSRAVGWIDYCACCFVFLLVSPISNGQVRNPRRRERDTQRKRGAKGRSVLTQCMNSGTGRAIVTPEEDGEEKEKSLAQATVQLDRANLLIVCLFADHHREREKTHPEPPIPFCSYLSQLAVLKNDPY